MASKLTRLVLVALLGLGLLTAGLTVAAALDLRRAKTAFFDGMTSAKTFDVAAARRSFAAGGRAAASAEEKLDHPLLWPARYVPVVGDNLRTVSALAKGARTMARGAEEALKAAAVFPTGPNGPEIGFSDGRINPESWAGAVERLTGAAKIAKSALVGVQAADGPLLPPVAEAREQFIEQGLDAATTLDTAGDVAGLIAYFFGADTPRTWFLVIQNPAEQRATGGFLGAFGILSADSGKLSLESFDANHALPEISSPAEAPQEFADNYDRFSSRTFWRNTNMTPDFPTAANVLANMWEQATQRRIDGVIAIDAVGLNQLLKLVGPVKIDPAGEINSDNFLPLALNEAYVRFPEREIRSSFLLDVGREVWSRLLKGNFSHPRALLDPMGDLVGTKRLQLWSRDEQERIDRLGVSGRLDPREGSDYLMVVGQNAGGNKIDYYARRQISYRVDLTDPQDVRGVVNLAIENSAPSTGLPPYIIGPLEASSQYPPGLNRTFVSVYLPLQTGIAGSTLDEQEVGVESKTEKGLRASSQWLETLSGKTSRLSLQTTARLAEPGTYRLVVQHQPTLNTDRFELEVVVPDGAVIRQVSRGMTVGNNVVSWTGVLDSEKEFLVRYGVRD